MTRNLLFSLTVLIVGVAAAPSTYAADLHSNSSTQPPNDAATPLPSDIPLSNLPEDKRKILKDALVESRAKNEKLYDETGKLVEQINAILGSAKFDKNAYLSTCAKLGILRAKIRTNEEEALASVAAQFSQEERKVLVKWREMRHHREEWSQQEQSQHYDATSRRQIQTR